MLLLSACGQSKDACEQLNDAIDNTIDAVFESKIIKKAETISKLNSGTVEQFYKNGDYFDTVVSFSLNEGKLYANSSDYSLYGSNNQIAFLTKSNETWYSFEPQNQEFTQSFLNLNETFENYKTAILNSAQLIKDGLKSYSTMTSQEKGTLWNKEYNITCTLSTENLQKILDDCEKELGVDFWNTDISAGEQAVVDFGISDNQITGIKISIADGGVLFYADWYSDTNELVFDLTTAQNKTVLDVVNNNYLFQITENELPVISVDWNTSTGSFCFVSYDNQTITQKISGTLSVTGNGASGEFETLEGTTYKIDAIVSDDVIVSEPQAQFVSLSEGGETLLDDLKFEFTKKYYPDDKSLQLYYPSKEYAKEKIVYDNKAVETNKLTTSYCYEFMCEYFDALNSGNNELAASMFAPSEQKQALQRLNKISDERSIKYNLLGLNAIRVDKNEAVIEATVQYTQKWLDDDDSYTTYTLISRWNVTRSSEAEHRYYINYSFEAPYSSYECFNYRYDANGEEVYDYSDIVFEGQTLSMSVEQTRMADIFVTDFLQKDEKYTAYMNLTSENISFETNTVSSLRAAKVDENTVIEFVVGSQTYQWLVSNIESYSSLGYNDRMVWRGEENCGIIQNNK